MLGKTLFLSLGLIAAVTLGCEKKSETPAPPENGEIEEAAGEHAEHAEGAMEEAVEEGTEAVEDAKEDTKEAIDKVEVPGQ